jgi:streptogramin lyase
MRKHHKQIISGIIESLGEACAEIQKAFFNKDTQTLNPLLADCADVAAQISNYIVELDGEESKTVKLLGEYADILHRIYNEPENGYELIKQLKKQIVTITDSVKNDIKTDKLEVVFFPYKASMWDALESIYLAAKEDPQCEAYVVPIPYYEKRPDGSFGQMHYEGGEYPDYVPVVDWESYNVEERRPDAIFVHNLYDENNYVTSVHPDYYNKKLREFTDMLVYSPYFVIAGETIDEKYCINSGTLYAHKVIVQSEKIRQEYIKQFEKFEKDKNCVGKFGNAEKKFLALGSPKFDKVINSKREDFKLLDEWKALIGGKKVVLYNTSLGAILQNDEQYLLKLRSVLETFRERDDIVLWWRPHPLSVTTFESIRPHIAYKYKQIVENYRREGFGIYDDTADLHRAISWSDAYYGDGSSLLAMYGVAGKPLMIQDINWEWSDSFYKYIIFDNFYDDGEYYWFTAFNFNALFKMDKQTWTAEYMGSFPNVQLSQFIPFGSVIHHNGKLYFSPRSADAIAEYDIKNKTFREINISRDLIGLCSKSISLFANAVNYRSWFFFIPSRYKAIIRYNIETGELDCFVDFIKQLNYLKPDLDYGWFSINYVVIGNLLYLPSANSNAVVVFDMDSCTSKIYEFKNNFIPSGICFDGNDFWIIPRSDNPIVKWNPETGLYKEHDYPPGFKHGNRSFQSVVFAGGYIWVFPYEANMALKINPQSDTVEIAEEFQAECEKTSINTWDANYFCARTINDKIYANTVKSMSFIEYDCKTKQRREEEVVLSEKAVKEISRNHPQFFYSCFASGDGKVISYGPIRLEGFLNHLINESKEKEKLSKTQIELFKNKIANSDGTAGGKIYSYCKGKTK